MCGAPRATLASDPLIGAVVAERYLLRERIGQGGSGTIYRADHVALRRKVAVKILHHELSRDDLAVERFRREATTVSEIDNEHIALVLDFGRAPDGRPFLAMELLEGETLQAALHREGTLPVDQALDVLTQVGEALMEAHGMGYVHRDLRPGNIFLTRRKGKSFVKILDFGLAKLIEGDGESAASTMGMTFGDPCYMSPEQARGEGVDRRADIYALGVMAFEILTGQPPFIGDRVFDVLTQHIESTPATPSALRSEIPEWLDAVVLRALAKQPDERFITVYRFIEALREGQVSGAVMSDEAALSMPAIEPPPPAPRRKGSDTGVIVHPAGASSSPPPSPSRRVTMPPMEPGASEVWYDAGDQIAISDSAERPVVSDTFADTAPIEKRSRSPLFAALGIIVIGAAAAGGYLFYSRSADEPAPEPAVATAPSPPTAAEAAPTPAPEVPTVVAAPAAAPPPEIVGVASPPTATTTAPAPPAAEPSPPAPSVPDKRVTKTRVAAARPTKPAATKAAAPPVIDLRPRQTAETRAATTKAAPLPATTAETPPTATAAPPLDPSENTATEAPSDPKPEPSEPATAEAPGPTAAPALRPPPADRNQAQAEFYVKIGQRALRDGDADGAIENFNKARGYDNLNADAIAGLGAVALKQGRAGDATVHLEAAARLAPSNSRIQTLRGQAYLAAGKRDEAAAAFKKALKLDPDDQTAVAGYREASGAAPSGAAKDP
jgi:serine/threonine protein kinase